MSRDHQVQQQLEAAQAQIQHYAHQLAAERDAARQAYAQQQGQLEQQQRHIAQLEAQTHRLQWMANTSPATTYSCEVDPPYSCTYISQSLETVLGYTPDEFKAEPDFWEQRLHPEDAPGVFAAIPQLFEQSKLQHDYRLRHRDGHYLWIRDTLVLFRDAQGLPQEVVGYFTDISEQKRLDAEREQSEQRIEQELQRIAQENRQFRETLIAQEATYRHLFDCNPQPMWVYDLETLRFLAVNDAAIAKYGYARAEFLAMTIADIRPSEDVPRLLENVAQVASGLDIAGVWQHCLQDGQIIQVEIVSYALEFAGRRAELVMAQDVTERIRVERALRHSEERYRLLVELAPQIVWSADMAGRHIYVSKRMGEYVGLATEQLMDFDWQFIVHPDDLGRVRDRWIESVQTGMPYETEYRMRRANGDYRWHLSQAIRVQSDQEIQWLGMATDIHDRKQAEFALQDLNHSLEQKVAERTADLYRSQAEVRAILNNSPAKIYVEDLEGRYIFVNQTFLRLFNCQPEDVIGKTIHEFFPPEIADTLRANDLLLLEQGGVQQFEEIVRVNGEDRVFLSNKFLLRDEQGEVYALCGMSTDITDRKAVEVALKESRDYLQAMLAALPDHVFRVNRDGVYLDFYPSDSTLEITGLATLVGRTMADVLPPEVAQAHRHRIEQALTTKTIHVSEQQVEVDGALLVREVRVAPCGPNEVLFVIRDITDRKQAEFALRKSEARYRQLFNSIEDGFCIAEVLFDDAGTPYEHRFLETNPAFSRHCSLASVDPVGKTASELIPGIASFWNDLYAQVLSTGKPIRQDIRSDVLDCWFEVMVCPVGEDAPHQVFVLFADVGDRKQAEIALQNLSDRLSLVLEAGQLGVWSWDLDRQLYWDAALCRMYGIPESSQFVPWQAWRSQVHHDDIERVEALRQAAIEGAPFTGVEFRIWRTDGELRWIQSFAQVQHDAQGNPARMVGINRDITDRKQAETALRKSEEELRLFINASSDIVYRMSADWQEMKPLDGKEFLVSTDSASKSWLDPYIPPVEQARVWAAIQHAIQTKSPFELEHQVLRQDGTVGWTFSRAIPVLNEQGDILEWFGAASDISDRKRAELDLQHTNAELARATRLKDEFLANMSHELRTPLNAILGMTEGLQEAVFGPLTDRQRRSLTTIETSGNHLLSLINDVLDVAKIESGQFELDYAAVNVCLLCNSSLTLVKQQAHKKGLHLETHVPSTLPEIYGDERRLRQMLVNLLSNAVKFTPAGGRITVTAAYTALSPEAIASNRDLIHPEVDLAATVGILTLSVADTGIGISPENAKKLFQPFIQIDSALNRQYQGTGLGLALVKRIAEIHGGKVTLTSAVGSGSCFTLQLPIIPIPTGHVSATAIPSSIEAIAPLDPTTAPLILLAEDNAANVSTITAYLTAKGYALIVAQNGLEAVNLATSANPDLILMDIQMPQLDGLEAIRQIRQNPALANVPIVALTALAMPADRERCLAAGADDYISKPIRLKQLAQMIPTLLAKPSAE
ncbi:PAS domain S-box protein [Nodosilinea sp. LEGE 07298]|uniref:PAS domain S-box protein n=1 Tax=Nodosilinea sp. LEGE 07298 TaxID=2777970 RepID=UPI001880697B|nr:PAS domain S-box protein [Nodosilinea sp. LEGE 07298]MBE9109232.1 PAS domain S-box protein [Nodosilinea sp. LEGE 07298]